jgi:hypothetical protein
MVIRNGLQLSTHGCVVRLPGTPICCYPPTTIAEALQVLRPGVTHRVSL